VFVAWLLLTVAQTQYLPGCSALIVAIQPRQAFRCFWIGCKCARLLRSALIRSALVHAAAKAAA